MVDIRKETLEQWLRDVCRLQNITLQAMAGDASFRRYFRIQTPSGSFVAMDAKPPQENCRPYVAIAKALRGIGLNTPEIIHADIKQGFLLVTDFGDSTYLKILNAQNADKFYSLALKALALLQDCRDIPGRSISLFTHEFMWQEWAWHKEWFLEKLLKLQLRAEEKDLDTCFAHIVESAETQPQVFMHRDYHSANLMALPDNTIGILDFQDAFMGPVTYDLVSLLRDCYIDWPHERVTHWALAYQQQVNVLRDIDQQEFLHWFDLMGMERHLKALFTFARKHVRDHQSQYLNHIPRTLGYLLDISQRYPEFSILHDYLSTTVQPAFESVLPCEA